MPPKRRVLIAGESWTIHSIHQKGFDSFTTTEYAEGVRWLKRALHAGGWEVEHQPAHIAAREFPLNVKELSVYDCVILSDIGANTLLLHPETFSDSRALPNRLDTIADYVRGGGGFVMVGGYLTFQGIDGKARYSGTAVEDTLPVFIEANDDRSEQPQGITPIVLEEHHPIVSNIGSDWPDLLGYNRVAPKPDGTVITNVGHDPLLVTGQFGQGRSVAFTSDCGPHWAPLSFVEWPGYEQLWKQIVGWASGD